MTYFKWRRPVGLKAADPFHSWLLLWLPALYILGYLGFAYNLGLPSTLVIGLVFINSMRVGVEEELMFRGILFQGLLPRFDIWPAIGLTTFLYGSAHLLNGFLTGDFSAALFQSLQAFMIGLMLLAIRLRTKSLYPAIAIHALWNFAIFTLSVAGGLVQGSAPAGADPSFIQQLAVGILVPLSLFLYGLWLLRGIGQKEKEQLLS